MQGSPSQTGSWGAGVGEGDTGVPQHPQSCPGMMPQQRGCSRAGVHPAIVRAGGSRAATPAGPPTTHFWAAGSWAQSQGAAGGGGWQHWGQLRSWGRRRGRKRAGKKQKSSRRKPKLARLQHQPCARGAKELPAELGVLWGDSRAAGQEGCGHRTGAGVLPAQLSRGWGQRALASCWWGQGDRGDG